MTVKQLSERIEALEGEVAELKAALATQAVQVHHHWHYESAKQPQPITYPYNPQWPYQWWYSAGGDTLNGTSAAPVTIN